MEEKRTHSGNQCNLFCTKCGVLLTSAIKGVGRGATCKACENSRKRKERKYRQLNIQLKLIERLGGKCTTCNKEATKENMVCFDFHHIHKEDKESAISNMLAESRPYKIIEKEADKCILLCACCHRLHHHINGY